jgi:hypothetical protein
MQPSSKGGKLAPFLLVANRVIGVGVPYSTRARFVALVLGKMLRPDENGRFYAFPSIGYLMRQSGMSEPTVERAMKELTGGTGLPPVFARSKPGITRGRRHRSYRYTLIENPGAYATTERSVAIAPVVKPLRGCVTDDEHRRIAAGERVESDDDLMAHISACSRCGEYYERALVRRRRSHEPMRTVAEILVESGIDPR